jgi:hypothetical protein
VPDEVMLPKRVAPLPRFLLSWVPQVIDVPLSQGMLGALQRK